MIVLLFFATKITSQQQGKTAKYYFGIYYLNANIYSHDYAQYTSSMGQRSLGSWITTGTYAWWEKNWGSSVADKSMPCSRCLIRTRVVLSTALVRQTALKSSCWMMHLICWLLKSTSADASAISLLHRHSRKWFNVAIVQVEHLH